MKREDLIRELREKGCVLDRHGGRHDIYLNPANGRKAPVPRHREIRNTTCRQVREQLGLNIAND